MCAFLIVSKFLSHVSQQRNKEAKKSWETDKQRTSNIKEAGIIGKRLFPCSNSGLWVKRQQVAWLQKYGTHKLEIPLPPLYNQAFAFLIKGYQQLSRQQGKNYRLCLTECKICQRPFIELLYSTIPYQGPVTYVSYKGKVRQMDSRCDNCQWPLNSHSEVESSKPW